MRSHTRRAVRSFGVLSCLGLISYGLIGCGGSDSSTPTPSPSATATPRPGPTPTPAPTRARVVIAWGARTRVEGLSSALSAQIRFTGAREGGGDVVYNAERPGTTGAPSEEYTSTDNAIAGRPFPLTVTFYSEPNLGGSVVGVAQASATVKADGSIDSTIATYGTIRNVIVDQNQTVTQGQAITLRYSGRDADGNIIMIRPGAAKINITGGADKLAVEGENLRGIRPREATIVVTVDQANSPATAIFILSDATITPNVSALTLSIEKSFDFSASVTGTGVTDTGVVWALVNPPTGVNITPAGRLTVQRLENTFTVTGTSVYDSAKVVSIPVTVISKVTVAILDKASAIVGIGDKIRFSALVSDPDGPLPDAGVTWQVVNKATNLPANGFGTIDADGVYTAPGIPGSYRVVAVSRFDTRKTDFVDVDVRAGSANVEVR